MDPNPVLRRLQKIYLHKARQFERLLYFEPADGEHMMAYLEAARELKLALERYAKAAAKAAGD